jgi:predicted FMN-binding regulatory protein PaiB
MKRLFLIAILVLSIAGFSQEKSSPTPPAKAPDFALTEVQKLRLENLQLKAKLKQNEASQAQATFQQALSELVATANSVKEANKWPNDTEFNLDTLTFSAPPPPAKPEAKK